jgi:2-polyprenyl-3-methyl-5-hydroxy-6-metoxy-1,4-benzoquinol methylase
MGERESMRRSHQAELLDADGVSKATLRRAYQELWMVNRFLGNTWAVLRLLRTAQCGAGSVLDIGCGQGALLLEIRKRTGAQVVGLDMRDAPEDAPVTIVTGNAVTDSLPRADVAVCVLMAHHLAEDDVVDLIRNVSRSCERLILLDLVRHRVPLVLFSIFVAPFLCRVNRADGKTSIRKAFTPREMQAMVDVALSGTGRQVARKRHTVAPFWIRQVVDIRWV